MQVAEEAKCDWRVQIPTNSRRGNTVLNRSSCASKRISHKADSSPQKPIWAFALWESHCVTCPSGFSRRIYCFWASSPFAMFSLKRSGSPIQSKKKKKKNLGNLPAALPSRRLALAETKSPSNQGKMKKTLRWETVRCLSENTTREGGRSKGESEG